MLLQLLSFSPAAYEPGSVEVRQRKIVKGAPLVSFPELRNGVTDEAFGVVGQLSDHRANVPEVRFAYAGQFGREVEEPCEILTLQGA